MTAILGTLVERDGELLQLETLLQASAAGRGAAAAVVGPAGIGKTSLLAAVRDSAARAGATCLAARGGELERGFSLGVVRQLFERPLRRLPAPARHAALEGPAAPAARLAGFDDAAAVPGADSTFGMVHALYWVCANLAQSRALLVVVDDLHWADPASLQFLAYLTRRVDELPVFVLTASRPVAGRVDAELVEAVTAAPAVQRITPRPLTLEGVAAVAAQVLPQPPEPAFVRACHEATAGNPFLCFTLMAAVGDEGAAVSADGTGALLDAATGSVSALVVQRLGGLGAAAGALSRAVAVLGTDVELHHAAALAELDPADAVTAADLLVAYGVLAGGRPIDFVHPLVRAAVHDQIPSTERARLHARAARLLAAAGAPPERTAAHLLAADPAGNAVAVEGLRAAAATAASHGDPRAAVAYLRRALREPPPVAVRGTLLHELGVAQLHSGDPASAREHLEEARQSTNGALERAQIARDLALALTTPGHFGAATAVLAETIVEVADLDLDLARRLEGELYQAAMMDPSLYRGVADRCVRLTDEIAGLQGRTPGERAVLTAVATDGLLRTRPAAEVREASRRAFAGGLLDDQTPYSSLWGNAAFPLIFTDAFADIAGYAEQALEVTRRWASPVGSARAYAVRSLLHLRQGSVPDAANDARVSIDLGLRAGFQVSLIPLSVLIEALVEQEDLDTAGAVLRDAGRDGPVADRFLDNWVLMARARLRAAQGDNDAAAADLEELGERGRRGWWPWNPAMFPYRSEVALAYLRAGHRERARGIAQEELDLARRWGAPRTIGISLRALGEVEHEEPGLRLLRESATVLAGSGARLEHARSLVALGAALRRAGRRTEARDALRTGMEIAHRCGASAIARRARGELVATGARPRRPTTTGVDALTPSELRTARMAADGLTNREIAQALFVTMRTVEVHLTHAYQKLGISSRDALSGALQAG